MISNTWIKDSTTQGCFDSFGKEAVTRKERNGKTSGLPGGYMLSFCGIPRKKDLIVLRTRKNLATRRATMKFGCYRFDSIGLGTVIPVLGEANKL